MLKVIIAFLMIATTNAKSIVNTELVELLTTQNPFYIFPEDNSGLYQIQRAYTDGCTFAFSDSLSLTKLNLDKITYTSTKLFSLSQLDYAFIDYAQAPIYYRVYFGSNYSNIIDILNSTVEDGTQIRILANRNSKQSLIRFQNLEDAEKAWDFMTNHMEKCRKK